MCFLTLSLSLYYHLSGLSVCLPLCHENLPPCSLKSQISHPYAVLGYCASLLTSPASVCLHFLLLNTHHTSVHEKMVVPLPENALHHPLSLILTFAQLNLPNSSTLGELSFQKFSPASQARLGDAVTVMNHLPKESQILTTLLLKAFQRLPISRRAHLKALRTFRGALRDLPHFPHSPSGFLPHSSPLSFSKLRQCCRFRATAVAETLSLEIHITNFPVSLQPLHNVSLSTRPTNPPSFKLKFAPLLSTCTFLLFLTPFL